MKNPAMPVLKGAGDFFFKFRNALFPVAGLALALFSGPASFPESGAVNGLLATLGAVLALAGQILRLMVIGYDYIKRGGKDGKVYADHLVTGGFYAICRNPMYGGNTLIVAGFAMAFGSWAGYVLAVPFFLFVYASIIIAEESYLAGRFGTEFQAYKRDVPRFIPRWSRLGQALEGSRYDWKKALRKDYGQVFQTLIVLTLIGMARVRLAGGPVSDTKWTLLATVAIASALFFAVSRYLKKTNRLASEVKTLPRSV